jgi:hypothetical protein
VDIVWSGVPREGKMLVAQNGRRDRAVLVRRKAKEDTVIRMSMKKRKRGS